VIERAKLIPGFMNDAELEWLAERATGCQRIAEVGSWLGRSTRALADNTKGTVWCIDTWEGSTNGDLQDIVSAHPKGWAFEQFRRNLADCSNVFVRKQHSVIAAQSFRDEQFDFIFIDASHDYRSVLNDIWAWRPKVMKGGILAGHDYCPERWPGVKRAVDELCPEHRTMEPNNGERSIWWTNV
jgi:predicted O-methyltransferase YrrM